MLGLNFNLVELVNSGKFPVVFVFHTGYTVAFVEVSSVVPVFVAFVAFVAIVADAADPSMLVPVRVWLALARLRAIAVVPT